MADEHNPAEPTQQEVEQALDRLRKQKAYRKEYQEKKKDKLESDPVLAEKEKEKRKKYFDEHKDQIYSKRKDYYEKNKDKIKAYHKKYHDKQNATMKMLRERAKDAGMKLEEYLESIA